MFCLEIWLGQGIVDSNVFNITLGIQICVVEGEKESYKRHLENATKKKGIFERH